MAGVNSSWPGTQSPSEKLPASSQPHKDIWETIAIKAHSLVSVSVARNDWVMVHGLGKTEYNGLTGQALRYDETKQRWIIQLTPNQTCLSIKTANIRVVDQPGQPSPSLRSRTASFSSEHTHVPLDCSSTATFSAGSTRSCGDSSIRAHTRVEIHGLQESNGAYNGERGIAVVFITRTGRWMVVLDKDETLAVRPKHLQSLSLVSSDNSPVIKNHLLAPDTHTGLRSRLQTILRNYENRPSCLNHSKTALLQLAEEAQDSELPHRCLARMLFHEEVRLLDTPSCDVEQLYTQKAQLLEEAEAAAAQACHLTPSSTSTLCLWIVITIRYLYACMRLNHPTFDPESQAHDDMDVGAYNDSQLARYQSVLDMFDRVSWGIYRTRQQGFEAMKRQEMYITIYTRLPASQIQLVTERTYEEWDAPAYALRTDDPHMTVFFDRLVSRLKTQRNIDFLEVPLIDPYDLFGCLMGQIGNRSEQKAYLERMQWDLVTNVGGIFQTYQHLLECRVMNLRTSYGILRSMYNVFTPETKAAHVMPIIPEIFQQRSTDAGMIYFVRVYVFAGGAHVVSYSSYDLLKGTKVHTEPEICMIKHPDACQYTRYTGAFEGKESRTLTSGALDLMKPVISNHVQSRYGYPGPPGCDVLDAKKGGITSLIIDTTSNLNLADLKFNNATAVPSDGSRLAMPPQLNAVLDDCEITVGSKAEHSGFDKSAKVRDFMNKLQTNLPTVTDICFWCSKEAMAPAEKFKVCRECKVARYCSTKCQRAHWKAIHRRECKDLAVKRKFNWSKNKTDRANSLHYCYDVPDKKTRTKRGDVKGSVHDNA